MILPSIIVRPFTHVDSTSMMRLHFSLFTLLKICAPYIMMNSVRSMPTSIPAICHPVLGLSGDARGLLVARSVSDDSAM